MTYPRELRSELKSRLQRLCDEKLLMGNPEGLRRMCLAMLTLLLTLSETELMRICQNAQKRCLHEGLNQPLMLPT